MSSFLKFWHTRQLNKSTSSMSKAICHCVPQFTFKRLKNGGVLVESGTIESFNRGLLLSHFLIYVEYENLTTRDINVEVIHKKSLTEIKCFFENQEHNILKYFCKTEAAFLCHVNEEKERTAANLADYRSKNRQVMTNTVLFWCCSLKVFFVQNKNKSSLASQEKLNEVTILFHFMFV